MKELQMMFDKTSEISVKNIFKNCLEEKKSQSYYEFNEARYMETLQMNTPVELMQQLRSLWGEALGETEQYAVEPDVEQLIRIITVMAFKLKTESKERTDSIKERIYNF